MSGTLTFKNDAVFKAAVAEAKELGCRICLVKDDGVYLLSEKRKGKETAVAYAKGLSPKDKDCWDKARDVMGGDDCVEYLDRDVFEKIAADNVADFKIVVTPKDLKILV